MVPGCVTSLTNGCSEMLTGLCETGWEEPPGETCLLFFGGAVTESLGVGGGLFRVTRTPIHHLCLRDFTKVMNVQSQVNG